MAIGRQNEKPARTGQLLRMEATVAEYETGLLRYAAHGRGLKLGRPVRFLQVLKWKRRSLCLPDTGIFVETYCKTNRIPVSAVGGSKQNP